MRDVREGRLPPPVKIGTGPMSHVRFDLDEVEAAIERRFAQRDEAPREPAAA
jgi:predicted DNA-binding transcriptional regulator AlpA